MGTLSPKNSFLVVTNRDFNAKLKCLYFNDTTTSQGDVLENSTSQFQLKQILKEPAHILDHSSSCIDLIFTSQAKLITESWIYTCRLSSSGICKFYLSKLLSSTILLRGFFFYLGFLSRTFTIHRTAGEGGGYLFNSSLPLPPASRTLRH